MLAAGILAGLEGEMMPVGINPTRAQQRAKRKAGAVLEGLERGSGGDRRSTRFQTSNDGQLKSDYARVLAVRP